MRVLIVTTNFPRWEGDPHSPWLVELLGLLRPQGFDVEILAPAYAGQESHFIDDMPVHRYRYAPARWETLTHEEGAPAKIRKNPLYLLLLPFYLLSGIVAAWQVGRRTDFDVIYVHWPVPQGILGWVARMASRSGSPRLVAKFYGSDLVLTERFAIVKPFVRWFARHCDDVGVNSSYTSRMLTDLTGVKPRLIPEGIHMPPADTECPTQPGKILYVGRLIPRKGVGYLIEAVSLLIDDPNLHLTIVGGGVERDALEELVRQLDLTERVTFTGPLPNFAGSHGSNALEEHYRTCEIFVLPSVINDTGDTETLGVVLLEAMRYRRPVIGSNVGGIPDIVRPEESGLLVPQKDAQALAAAIKRLRTDQEFAHRLGEAGYAYARNHFAWDVVAQATLALFGFEET